MSKHFFFGATDSPLYMFQHALGVVVFLIFICFLLAVLINYFLKREKIKKNIQEKQTVEPLEIIQDEKVLRLVEGVVEEKKTSSLETASPSIIIQEPIQQIKEENIEFVVYEDSDCNLKEHLFFFTELILNKKLTEQDWDRRMPQKAWLDNRNYHQLIFLLINLNPNIEETTSRFKLVLETASEVAINHQIYFRNWVMPPEMISGFKMGNEMGSNKKEILKAVKIAEGKKWKLQVATSEQGTMINLLMKLKINKTVADQ